MVVSRGWGWREMGRFEGIRNHMGSLDLYSHLTIIRSLCSSPSIWGRIIGSLVVGQDSLLNKAIPALVSVEKMWETRIVINILRPSEDPIILPSPGSDEVAHCHFLLME